MELSLGIPFQESEDLLVEQALKRDKDAFAALYERYVDRVYRHAYYRVGNQSDAEDITGEAFIRAWKAIDKYKRTGAPFIAWLITITHNLIVDHYKSGKARKSQVPLEDVDCAANSDSNPEAVTEANADREHLREAIMKLKGEKQQVILMHFIDGFSYAEIAQALNKSEGAVRVIQCRALSELRHILTG